VFHTDDSTYYEYLYVSWVSATFRVHAFSRMQSHWCYHK